MPSTTGFQPGGAPRRVMIVEDDPALSAFYRSALQFAGYVVVTAEDGVAALREIDGSQPPHALILDLNLPRLSGHDVSREVAIQLPRLPILVVTGSTEPIDPAGFAGVLRKPITATALIHAVEECLQRCRLPHSRAAAAHPPPGRVVRVHYAALAAARRPLKLRRRIES